MDEKICDIMTSGKVLVLSDWHIGLDGLDRAKMLVETAKAQLGEYSHLILAGDTLELWRYGEARWHHKCMAAKARELIGAVPGLKELLEDDRVVLLHGNHDFALTYLPGMSVYTYARVNSKLVVAHGNNADEFNNVAMEGWSGTLRAALDWLRATFWEAIGVDVSRLEGSAADVMFVAGGQDELYEEYALELARKNGARFVALGHTHKPSIKVAHGVMYGNCGSCITDIQGLEFSEEAGMRGVTLAPKAG